MSDKKYSHVIVVGIDGAGSFIKNAVTPHFDRIFAESAVTYKALSSNPTISAECWGSMLLGVGPEVHKLNNGLVMQRQYPLDSPFPSLFRRIREAMPDARLGSYCDWNPITFGIVESNAGVDKDTDRDTALTPRICNYIKEAKPTFLFVQMDSVDGAGHTFDYGTPEHLDRINVVDNYLGDIHEAAKEAGILDDTLFIAISDHGGINRAHGGWTDVEKYVTFAAKGKGISKSEIEEMNIRDLAAIVLYALGIDLPALDEQGWTSQIPAKIFNDPTIAEYRDLSHLTGAEPRISKAPHTSEPV